MILYFKNVKTVFDWVMKYIVLIIIDIKHKDWNE